MPRVIVTCEGIERRVFVNNQLQGLTDTALSVPVGLHVFDLGLPADYLPAFQEIFVDREPDPTVVPFTPVAAFVARSSERLRESRRAAAEAAPGAARERKVRTRKAVRKARPPRTAKPKTGARATTRRRAKSRKKR